MYVLTDGVWAAAVVLAAALFGLCPLALILPRDFRAALPLRWQLGLGAGLGLGTLCLAVLGLGLAGLLSRPILVSVLGVMGLAGALRLGQLLHRAPRPTPAPRVNALLVLLLPHGVMSLLVATVPPGVLWTEEARGYDVLEYHLQVPKVYYEQGRITYLPNNIYSNFPMNAEMLSLLAMVLRQDAVEAAILAKLINALVGFTWVFVAWLIGRESHPAAGVAAALLAGTSPWLMYLSGVAYVENGMLLFGMLAFAGVRLAATAPDPAVTARLALLSGAYAGWSCGFKYTAVPMIAVPLLGMWVAVSCRQTTAAGVTRSAAGVAGRRLLLCLAGCCVTFAPWLIKNAVATGNPVFPLAYGVLGARQGIWTDELAERWQRGHRPVPQEAGLAARAKLLARRVLADRRLGWWLVVLALPAVFSRARTRLDLLFAAVLLFQVGVWLFWTHLYARFAVVLLIPLCILGARSVWPSAAVGLRAVPLIAVCGVAAFNLWTSAALYRAELFDDGRSWRIHGHIEWFYQDADISRNPAAYIRQRLRATDRVLMVGEARTFYMPPGVDSCVVFNRNPFAEAVAAADSDEAVIRWLNEQQYTYILVNFSEMERLRRTYGFWKDLTPDLFERLGPVGLRVIQRFGDSGSPAAVILYEVRELPPAAPGRGPPGLPG